MKIKLLFIIILIGLVAGCNKHNDNESINYSFTGKAQKGPFITGTIVTLNELNANLDQTGKIFTVTITSDDGSFGIKNIGLNSNLALLTATGYYFGEIYGELSATTLTLQAIADLTDKGTININVLTHLIRGRIEYLVANGKTFHEAHEQAKTEMLTFLGAPELSDKDFEAYDISQDNDYNALLLAFSVILQRYNPWVNQRPTMTAELTQLLSQLSSDFKDNGLIDNTKLIDTLLYNISQLNMAEVRLNIEKRYSDLGISTKIPDFEKYIVKFQKKYCSHLYTNFYYPDIAPPEPAVAPDSKLPNLLVPADTVFQAYSAYSIAAIIPFNFDLTIKFISDNTNHIYIIGGTAHGWLETDDYPHGFTLKSQRQNELMTMLFHLEEPGTAKIEYYENGSLTPAFTKTIKWN